MKFIGMQAGQFGDLVMNTVVARAIKQDWPDSHLTMGIGKPYEGIAPLFKNHPHIDAIHIWENYNGLTEGDKKFIEENKFDKVFNPMPEHKSGNWYNEVKCHTEEACRMHDLEPPDDLSCYLEKWFEPITSEQKFICFVPFTAHDSKNMSEERWGQIVEYITNKGLAAIQLSSPNQPRIKGARFRLESATYFGSVKVLLGSEFLISLDSGMAWVSSAYKHPTLGLIGWNYPGMHSVKVHEPINSQAIYLEAPTDRPVNEIPLEQIFDNIDGMLK